MTDWSWSAPQIDIPLTFDKFLRYCSEAEKLPITSTTSSTSKTAAAAENNNNGSTTAATSSSRPLHYMTISAGEGCWFTHTSYLLTAYLTPHSYHHPPLKRHSPSRHSLFYSGRATPWIADSLPFFTATPSFFIVDPAGYKGINCRFGMRGVTAATHYDGNVIQRFISLATHPPTVIHPINYHIDNH